MTEHVCGLKGYTPWVDPPCPGCEAPMLVMPDLNRQRELPLVAPRGFDAIIDGVTWQQVRERVLGARPDAS